MANDRVTRLVVASDIQAALAALFRPEDIRWKPQSVKGNRALAVAYIDARTVEDRLDSVVGVDGWQDDYETLVDGSVVCRLRIKIGDEWITKVDVGSPSDQSDGGDRMKAAFSDALKRAAVKFGIGRFLYDLPKQWCDYDPVKRQFVQVPQLPARYLSAGVRPTRAATAPANGKLAGSLLVVTAEQAAELSALLEKSGRDRAKFLTWVTELIRRRYPAHAEIREVGQLPADAFKMTRAMLEKACQQKT